MLACFADTAKLAELFSLVPISFWSCATVLKVIAPLTAFHHVVRHVLPLTRLSFIFSKLSCVGYKALRDSRSILRMFLFYIMMLLAPLQTQAVFDS